MDMKKISRKELVGILLRCSNGASAISFLARTDARCRKNPFGKIFKVSKFNGMVNLNYTKTVERARIKEGKTPEFRKGESWHEPVVPEGKLTPLCVHKHDNDKAYLRFIIESVIGEPIFFTEGGDEVSKDQIKDYLQKRSGYQNQGLENPRRFITVDVANILEISIDGDQYQVEV
jgi:hypothetical protein